MCKDFFQTPLWVGLGKSWVVGFTMELQNYILNTTTGNSHIEFWMRIDTRQYKGVAIELEILLEATDQYSDCYSLDAYEKYSIQQFESSQETVKHHKLSEHVTVLIWMTFIHTFHQNQNPLSGHRGRISLATST